MAIGIVLLCIIGMAIGAAMFTLKATTELGMVKSVVIGAAAAAIGAIAAWLSGYSFPSAMVLAVTASVCALIISKVMAEEERTNDQGSGPLFDPQESPR
jgi:hypothetical protein